MKIMYKIFSSMLALCILTLVVSCSEKEENEIATSAELTSGIWKFESADFHLTVNEKDFKDFYMEAYGVSEEDAEEAMKNWESEETKYDATIEFTSDNKYEMIEPDEDSINGTWSLNEDGKKLTIDGITYEITSFSSNKMSLYLAISYEFDLDNDGTSDNFKNEITQHLKK